MTTSRPSARHISDIKQTKIIATIGPVTHSYESVLELIQSGADGIRLNFSHGNNAERSEQIKWVRKASKALGKPVAVIQDLQGPKIRLGDFEGKIEVAKGDELSFGYLSDIEESGVIPTQYDISKRIERGHRLFLADGHIRATVNSVQDGIVRARALNSGVLTQRKGINLPDTSMEGEVITAKDKKDIIFGAEHDVDYVALSFVQTEKDVKALKKLLKAQNSQAKIIAKIESQQALNNLDAIIDETDAAMVARGDLAIETPAESVPISQRVIIGTCIKKGKISIVATQLLGSMMTNDAPTRSEVSDVATSVIIGADAVMLSDETAMGSHPLKALKTMNQIINYTEKNSPVDPIFRRVVDDSVQSAVINSIVQLANQVGAAAIVAETKSGRTARGVAGLRPRMPIVMVTSKQKVANQLALAFGGQSYIRPDSRTAGTKLTSWLRQQKSFNKGDVVVISSGKDPGVSGGTDTIKVRVLE